MAVSDGQLVNASVSNAAWMSRLINTDTIGKVDLKHNSVTNLIHIQRIINEILSTVGLSNQAATDGAATSYSSNINILDGDTHKSAIEKLDAVLDVPKIRSMLLSYVNDAAYEADYAAVAGAIYFNSTDEVIRFHDGTQWKNAGSLGAMSREAPVGVKNGVNTAFTLSYVPISPDHISVFVDGIVLRQDQYSLAGLTLTINDAPFPAQDLFAWYFTEGFVSPFSPATGTENLEYHQITAPEFTAKQFNLAAAPLTTTQTMVDVIGGGTQQFGVDFNISGNVFDWSGYLLDGFLTTGDVVRLRYIS